MGSGHTKALKSDACLESRRTFRRGPEAVLKYGDEPPHEVLDGSARWTLKSHNKRLVWWWAGAEGSVEGKYPDIPVLGVSPALDG